MVENVGIFNLFKRQNKERIDRGDEMLIESSNNPKIKKWAKLKQKKYRYQVNEYIVEGEHLVLEALEAGVVKEILVREGASVPNEISTAEMDVYTLKENLFSQIASTETPQPMMAICSMQSLEISQNNRLLLLDRIQDPGNLGTLLRSALAFDFDGVILGEGCEDLYNEKVIRSTQGAIFKLAIQHQCLTETIEALKEQGVRVYGTSLQNGRPLREIETSGQMAFILGNEGSGVSKELLALTQQNIFIEMGEKIESLNVSIAGSIIMYQFRP